MRPFQFLFSLPHQAHWAQPQVFSSRVAAACGRDVPQVSGFPAWPIFGEACISGQSRYSGGLLKLYRIDLQIANIVRRPL